MDVGPAGAPGCLTRASLDIIIAFLFSAVLGRAASDTALSCVSTATYSAEPLLAYPRNHPGGADGTAVTLAGYGDAEVLDSSLS
jgi:hypothetical protein